ncbi:hypothetical protein [Mycoplasma suis]|uniref:Uncharacterized protein n=1 Tax=Mycoplasma suis (strain Illinois) TaxID=768700 RepID=F0QRT0_MYCSL|nr:hypothetical protein [Mycoplasma suis]ADX98200.1 hypothetical protein MSU_0669 [Mycoplasma suis str. Illinois]
MNSEWWIRGKEKNSLNEFLENEPQLSENIENYLRKENSSAKINLELLRSKCDITGEDKVEDWIVISCPAASEK